MIMEILAQILAPLSPILIITALISGAVLGAFYNYPLNLEEGLVFHKMVAGWNFIAFVFLFRLVTSLITGMVLTNFWGWIGIGILWGIYCSAIWGTEKVIRRLKRRQNGK